MKHQNKTHPQRASIKNTAEFMKNARSGANSKDRLQIPAKTYRDVRATVTNPPGLHKTTKSAVASAGPKQFMNKSSKLMTTQPSTLESHPPGSRGTYDSRNTVLPSLRAQQYVNKSDERNTSYYGSLEQPPNVHEIKEAYFGDGNVSDRSARS